MTKYVLIITDTNDADYDIVFSECDEEDVEIFRRIANAIQKVSSKRRGWFHNWPYSEYSNGDIYELYNGLLDKEDIDCFNDIGVHPDTHTVKTIKIINVTKEESLLGG